MQFDGSLVTKSIILLQFKIQNWWWSETKLHFLTLNNEVLCGVSLRSGGSQRILEDEDDGVSAEEHLGDESVLVDRLGLFLTWNQKV